MTPSQYQLTIHSSGPPSAAAEFKALGNDRLRKLSEDEMSTEIQKIRERTLDGMRSYIEAVLKDNGDPGYTDMDVDRCGAIIDSYIQRISSCKHGDEQSIMSVVRDTVFELNALNSEAGESLIETDQREDLAELIIKAAAVVGVGNGKDDLTEEWREW